MHCDERFVGKATQHSGSTHPLISDAFCHGNSSHTPGLGDSNELPTTTEAILIQILWELCGFTRTGLAHDNQNLVGFDGVQELLPVRE